MAALTGKVALVTGASRGIGRAIAERFAQAGAAVVVNYAQSAPQAQEVVATIAGRGKQAVALQADISRVPDVRRLFRDATAQFGHIDIVVNNAARFIMKPLADTTEEEFDIVFGLNARGAFFVLQEAARALSEKGRIINISTGATTVGLPGLGAYLASKSALEQFTLVLAKELGARGITVNTVSPGVTDTQMAEEIYALLPSGLKEMTIQRTLLGRLGQPQDIAEVVTFLASDEAGWITGQNIHANGGLGW